MYNWTCRLRRHMNQNLFITRTTIVLNLFILLAYHQYIESSWRNKLYICINIFILGVICSIYALNTTYQCHAYILAYAPYEPTPFHDADKYWLDEDNCWLLNYIDLFNEFIESPRSLIIVFFNSIPLSFLHEMYPTGWTLSCLLPLFIIYYIFTKPSRPFFNNTKNQPFSWHERANKASPSTFFLRTVTTYRVEKFCVDFEIINNIHIHIFSLEVEILLDHDHHQQLYLFY